MTEKFLRVKDNETGHEYSVKQSRFDANPNLYTAVDKPATLPSGLPLPPKYKTTVAKKAAENKAASQARNPRKTTDSPEPDEKAESPATDKEN